MDRENYAYAALSDIQGWSEIPRGVPLFETILVFENHPTGNLLAQEMAGLSLSDERGVDQTN